MIKDSRHILISELKALIEKIPVYGGTNNNGIMKNKLLDQIDKFSNSITETIFIDEKEYFFECRRDEDGELEISLTQTLDNLDKTREPMQEEPSCEDLYTLEMAKKILAKQTADNL